MLEYIRNATNMLWFGTKKSEPAPAVVEEKPRETQRFPVMYYYAVMNGLSIRCPASETEKEEKNGLSIRCPASETEKEEKPAQTNQKNETSKIEPINDVAFASMIQGMTIKARLEGPGV